MGITRTAWPEPTRKTLMTIVDASTPLPVRRRTFEDKTVRLLAEHAGKIYLGLLVLAILVVKLHDPMA